MEMINISRKGVMQASSMRKRKISFPADSVLCAVIQDGDVYELSKILQNERGEVNINQANHVGLTALHHAVLSNNLDAVKMLLCSGSEVNAQDTHGFSPLHTASACGFLQIVSILIAFGADVLSLTKQSELPVDLARDISVIRVLAHEMYFRFNNQFYIQNLIRCKLIQCVKIFQKLMKFLLRTFMLLYRYVINYVCKKIDMPRTPVDCRNQSSDVKTHAQVSHSTINNNKHKRKQRPVKLE